MAVPGQEWGLDEEGRPIPEVADECAKEILERVPGPIALYGHCGLGVMLAVEITRRLEAAGREVEVLHLGGVFLFSRPSSVVGRIRTVAEKMRSDRMWANGLIAAGLDVEELDDDQLRAIIKNRREGTREAEGYFTRLWSESGGPVINAPIVAVVGERDPATEFYQERFREWLRLAPASSCVVLDEAGHFFLKHRAEELAEIVTTREVVPRTAESTWWTQATSDEPVADEGPKPSMKRFGAVAAGQLVSIIGSSLTEFAVPLWIYVTTGSLVNFALFSVIGLLPGMLVAPLAGVIVDRYDRRKVMLAGDVGAWSTQLALGVLLWTGNLEIWAIYPLLAILSVALTFQRLAYGASIPQLVPETAARARQRRRPDGHRLGPAHRAADRRRADGHHRAGGHPRHRRRQLHLRDRLGAAGASSPARWACAAGRPSGPRWWAGSATPGSTGTSAPCCCSSPA